MNQDSRLEQFRLTKAVTRSKKVMPEVLVVTFKSFNKPRPVLFRKVGEREERGVIHTDFEADFEALREETGLVVITKELDKNVTSALVGFDYELIVTTYIEHEVINFYGTKHL